MAVSPVGRRGRHSVGPQFLSGGREPADGRCIIHPVKPSIPTLSPHKPRAASAALSFWNRRLRETFRARRLATWSSGPLATPDRALSMTDQVDLVAPMSRPKELARAAASASTERFQAAAELCGAPSAGCAAMTTVAFATPMPSCTARRRPTGSANDGKLMSFTPVP